MQNIKHPKQDELDNMQMLIAPPTNLWQINHYLG